MATAPAEGPEPLLRLTGLCSEGLAGGEDSTQPCPSSRLRRAPGSGASQGDRAEDSLEVWLPPPEDAYPTHPLLPRPALCGGSWSLSSMDIMGQVAGAPWWDLFPPRLVFVNLNFN